MSEGKYIGDVEINGELIEVFEHNYQHGGKIGIVGVTKQGEPFGTFSINVEDAGLQGDEFIFPEYKLSSLPDIKEGMLRSKHFMDTGRKASFGYVANQPILTLVRH